MLKILLILLSFTVLSCSKDMEDDSSIDATQDVTAEDAKQEDTFSICNRSQIVQKAILFTIQKSMPEEKELSCDKVTKDDLLKITNLEGVKDDLQQTTEVGLKQGDINLSDNKLKTLPENSFKGLKNLKLIDSNDNEFQKLLKDLVSLKQGDFDGLSNLTRINLSNNNLQDLPEGIFKTSQKLEQIDLANNNLTSIPEGTFSVEALPMLKRLYLQNNKFSNSYENKLEKRIEKDRKHLMVHPFFSYFGKKPKFALQLNGSRYRNKIK